MYDILPRERMSHPKIARVESREANVPSYLHNALIITSKVSFKED
jgi:hypothetical protein